MEMDDLPREELVAAIERVVGGVLAAAGVAGPPVDAVGLARTHFGLSVVFDDTLRPGPRRRAADGVVRLQPGLSPERQQEAAARAIGDRLREEVLRELRLEPADARGLAGASLTNQIARCLLVPGGWFRKDARAMGFDVARLAERYGSAGVELVALRLLDLEEPCVVSLVTAGGVTFRRSNGPRAGRGLVPAEVRCRDEVLRDDEERTVRADGWTVRGWPVGPGRVVLRSVYEPEA
jgi:hypothetical protein